MNGWQDPPQFLGSHFSSTKTTTLLSVCFLNKPEKENLNLKDKGQGGVTSPGPGSIRNDTVGSQGINDAVYPVFPGGGRAGGTGWNPLPLRFPQQFFFFFFLQNTRRQSVVGGRDAPAGPRRPLRRLRSPPPPALCLAPALPRTWSPVKFRAAPGDTCREVCLSTGPA